MEQIMFILLVDNALFIFFVFSDRRLTAFNLLENKEFLRYKNNATDVTTIVYFLLLVYIFFSETNHDLIATDINVS